MAFQNVDDFIDDLFDFHSADARRGELHQAVRDGFKSLAKAVGMLLPSTPERTLALRKLADAMREVNYAVSLGQADVPETPWPDAPSVFDMGGSAP